MHNTSEDSEHSSSGEEWTNKQMPKIDVDWPARGAKLSAWYISDDYTNEVRDQLIKEVRMWYAAMCLVLTLSMLIIGFCVAK